MSIVVLGNTTPYHATGWFGEGRPFVATLTHEHHNFDVGFSRYRGPGTWLPIVYSTRGSMYGVVDRRITKELFAELYPLTEPLNWIRQYVLDNWWVLLQR